MISWPSESYQLSAQLITHKYEIYTEAVILEPKNTNLFFVANLKCDLEVDRFRWSLIELFNDERVCLH